jgi:hypothetical protein
MKSFVRFGHQCLAVFVLFNAALVAAAQVNVTTFHNDIARTGQNTQETILTPANVNSAQFGKLFTVAVDGAVFAQPLYLSAVNIGGGTHNVVYVVTEHDSVYAIDADSGNVYAHVSLIPSGGSTVNSNTDLGCGDLIPEVGITSTPVLDPAGGTLYVVAKSKVNGTFYQHLHALDVGTLAEKLNGPVSIHAQVAGSGYDSSGGVVTFSPLQQNQRAALLLENGHVIISWSSHCDSDPWHGWMMSYSSSTLAQEAALNTTPNGSQGGIWMSGGGPAADASGHIYLATGNGTWNGTSDFSESELKLGPPANGTFPVLDYFTPYNQAHLTSIDFDLGSGGLLLLPPLSSGQQLFVQGTKSGTIYLVNAGNLGKYCVNLAPACSGSDPNVAQEIPANPGVWGSPAYWNGNVYWAGVNDNIKAYSFNAGGSGKLSTSPTSQSPQIFAFAAPTPSISSNGQTNAILWGLDGAGDDSGCGNGTTNCLGLFAYDATNLSHLLYSSAQAANGRDSAGTAVKFQAPIIANGKVYIGTKGNVIAYGLLDGALPAATSPVLSPPPGSYGSAQSVSLSDTTPGASIYYTINGTTPTTASTRYTGPFQVSTSETVQAIAVANGYQTSAVTSGSYVFAGPSAVNLSSVADDDAIVADGSPPLNGGFDHGGHSYSATLLGSQVTWGGNTYTFGAVGGADAVSQRTIPLPAGNYTAVSLLGAAVNGNQPSQTFIVTYTDGSTSTFVQGVSDWFTAHTYPGESLVKTMSYRISTGGTRQGGPVYLYGYSFALNSAKTAKSITLPNNGNVVILAVDVSGAPAQTQTQINYSAGFANATGLTLVGKGVSVKGAALQLTDAGSYEATAAWNAAPVNVQSFTTDFTFQISPSGSGTGDGFTFAIQKAAATAVGQLGGALGYQGIGSSVAIKFDLYSNAGEGTDSTGFYTGGAYPTTPAFDMTSSGVNLHSGDPMHAHVTYDGTTLTLTLTDTVTGKSFTGSRALNIPAAVGSNTAYVGFTAGTGGATAVQQILTWSYSNSVSSPAPGINDPSGFSSGNGFQFIGATLTNSTLELTDGGAYEARAVWSTAQFNVQKFTTDFTFLETAASADGLCFVIQNAGPAAVGGLGGGLGYNGIGTSVAVKFDLYSNSGEGSDSTGFYTNGAYPITPALDMTSSGVSLHNPNPMHAHITYDGTTLSLTLSDTVTGKSFATSAPLNIPTTVGGNSAYLGFTAGTGGASSVQQILNWTYVVN